MPVKPSVADDYPLAAFEIEVRGVFEIELRDDGARGFAVYDGKIARPRLYVEYPVDDVTEHTVRALWVLLDQIAPLAAIQLL